MAWMGLGGTSVNIPISILQVVSVSRVLEFHRHVAATELSANMLSQAKALCLGIVGPDYDGNNDKSMPTQGGYLGAGRLLNSRLIFANGDAELWLRMCSIANPSPVHVAELPANGQIGLNIREIFDPNGLAIDGASGNAKGRLIPASIYPTCAPGDAHCEVGDETGAIKPNLVPCDDVNVNLAPSDPKACNKWPWCLDIQAQPPSPTQQAWIDGPNHPPICPPEVMAASAGCKKDPAVDPPGTTCFGNEAANTWAVRGAESAGMSVFLYLRETLELLQAPPPDYNQCPN
jgi:hypothetical protein